MQIGIFLGHPAHFYMFRNVIVTLMNNGHKVHIVIKKKDILEDLLINSGYSYTIIREDRSDSRLGLVKSVLQMEFAMIRFIKKNKIKVLVGSTLSFASRVIARINVIVTGEDDAEVVPFVASEEELYGEEEPGGDQYSGGPVAKFSVALEGVVSIVLVSIRRCASTRPPLMRRCATTRPTNTPGEEPPPQANQDGFDNEEGVFFNWHIANRNARYQIGIVVPDASGDQVVVPGGGVDQGNDDMHKDNQRHFFGVKAGGGTSGAIVQPGDE